MWNESSCPQGSSLPLPGTTTTASVSFTPFRVRYAGGTFCAFNLDLHNKGERVKVNDEFSFPEALSLTPYIEDDAGRNTRDIRCAIHSKVCCDPLGWCSWRSLSCLHQGSPPTLLHFNSQCEDAWFDFNDSVVTAIEAEKISKQFGGVESAYMLMYQRVRVQFRLRCRWGWR